MDIRKQEVTGSWSNSQLKILNLSVKAFLIPTTTFKFLASNSKERGKFFYLKTNHNHLLIAIQPSQNFKTVSVSLNFVIHRLILIQIHWSLLLVLYLIILYICEIFFLYFTLRVFGWMLTEEHELYQNYGIFKCDIIFFYK